MVFVSCLDADMQAAKWQIDTCRRKNKDARINYNQLMEIHFLTIFTRVTLC